MGTVTAQSRGIHGAETQITRSPALPQEYMALQQALAAALRSGFLSLAQARYSMGAERVSVLQLPSHMSATTRLRVSGGCPRQLLRRCWPLAPSPCCIDITTTIE